MTIVGESVGDRLMFFAEGDGIDLPNTRAMIRPGTERARLCRRVPRLQ